LRGVDLNHRPLGYEPNELPGCSTPQKNHISGLVQGQTLPRSFHSFLSICFNKHSTPGLQIFSQFVFAFAVRNALYNVCGRDLFLE
jgi:hypothetical protein